ncbi:hypothetical protein B0H15DRAFT_807287 [Mycena belliarum]|uniref:Uncharacterized protein n=1 Tax=Mycena belliarum TaxID=1033014 RepID=A0AAD6TLC8_9AGAR|nr:hypothetical protein B0H15DRAFT_807287 [Mycena belliae]
MRTTSEGGRPAIPDAPPPAIHLPAAQYVQGPARVRAAPASRVLVPPSMNARTVQIWATDVEGLINDARDRAHLPADAIHSMPPVIFVGKGAAIFNRSTCDFGSRWPIVPVWVTNIEIPLPWNGLTSEEGCEENWRRYRDWTPPMCSMMVSPRPSNGFTSEEGCEENWRRYRDSTTPMDSMMVSGFIVGDPNYPAWRVNTESAEYKALRRAARTVAREAGETFGMLDVVRLRSGESHNSLF